MEVLDLEGIVCGLNPLNKTPNHSVKINQMNLCYDSRKNECRYSLESKYCAYKQ